MFVINLRGKELIYNQIIQQIKQFIYLGVLKENDRLPSVRTLSSELGINPNTVARAYQELEKEEVLYSLNKKGFYVAKVRDTKLELSKKMKLLESILKEVNDAGIPKKEVLDLVEKVYREEG